LWDFYDNLLYTFDLATKQVVRYAGLPRALAPLSSSLDGPQPLLAIGLWQELRVYRADVGEVELVAKRAVPGEVVACRLRNRRIVCISAIISGSSVKVFELRGDELHSVEGWGPSVNPGSPLALSADARFCAVVDRSGDVVVHDFESGETQDLEGHRSSVSLLHFTDGAAALISSSPNGQVMVRKRSGAAFAERCVPV
jgi:hypothetical protein